MNYKLTETSNSYTSLQLACKETRFKSILKYHKKGDVGKRFPLSFPVPRTRGSVGTHFEPGGTCPRGTLINFALLLICKSSWIGSRRKNFTTARVHLVLRLLWFILGSWIEDASLLCLMKVGSCFMVSLVSAWRYYVFLLTRVLSCLSYVNDYVVNLIDVWSFHVHMLGFIAFNHCVKEN